MSKVDLPLVLLGEVATPIARPVNVLPGQSYRTLGVKWWGEGAYERETIDGSKTAASQLYEVHEGDLIINKIWVRHGSIGIVPASMHGCAGSGEFPTFDLDSDRVLPRWIHWYSKTREMWTKCDALSQGTSGKNRIKPEKFLTVTVPLPPLSEQRRIVTKIEQLASMIEEAKGLRVGVREQSTALITSLHFGLAQQRTLSMQDILTLEELQEPVAPTGSYLQVGIKSFGLGLFPKKAVSGGETTYKHFNRLETGMVVLSQVKGWEGAVAVCPPHLAGFYASPEYRTFSCRKDASLPEYMAAVVSTPWFRRQLEIATHGVGGRRERVRPEKFLKLTIPMPTIEKQMQAVEVFRRLTAIEPKQAQTAAELDALLPSILDRAFRGEL